MTGNADSIDKKRSKWRKRKGRWKKLRRGYSIFPFHVTIFSSLDLQKSESPFLYPFCFKNKNNSQFFSFSFFSDHQSLLHNSPTATSPLPFSSSTIIMPTYSLPTSHFSSHLWPTTMSVPKTHQADYLKKPPSICNNITLPFFINLKLFHLKISPLHSHPQTTNHQIYHEAPSIVSLFLPFLTQPQPLM